MSAPEHALEVTRPGPLSTVQDLGRPGLASMGVGPSGAADRSALTLANRLVGNDESAAAIETTSGGRELLARSDATVAVTGAPCPVEVGGYGASVNTVLRVRAGTGVRLGTPASGLRSYLAVRGGVAVEPVLGSRSTDALSGLGPGPLAVGTPVPVGAAPGSVPTVEVAPVPLPSSGEVPLRAVPGPRQDWFTDAALKALVTEAYEVTTASDRIGMRLSGPVLERATDRELPSEGMVAGAVQVPPPNSRPPRHREVLGDRDRDIRGRRSCRPVASGAAGSFPSRLISDSRRGARRIRRLRRDGPTVRG
ncbi:biotin-dependent carboxylase-like uncharacterized protein [Saccharopolyspora lacisalsi]|uniref:Biotin-dependent carboxylase-like uncharacterized protein n=1 Tax=Halosaccharopolyspora lacisalsi TaxID=1000566 RepID=A0A839DQW6_9PSEU|nr:biotin-dependent carboxylase-like uncharacterized protein [Halosaccharopolyspora lacisalsi]